MRARRHRHAARKRRRLCRMSILDPRTIISIMGGDITGADSVLAPGPGHSANDRSLSIKIDPTDPQGYKAYSFAGDDSQMCRDYISAKLGLDRIIRPRAYRLQQQAT